MRYPGSNAPLQVRSYNSRAQGHMHFVFPAGYRWPECKRFHFDLNCCPSELLGIVKVIVIFTPGSLVWEKSMMQTSSFLFCPWRRVFDTSSGLAEGYNYVISAWPPRCPPLDLHQMFRWHEWEERTGWTCCLSAGRRTWGRMWIPPPITVERYLTQRRPPWAI